ncbi:MAG: DivIVA domain-containing protein [Oscillospiraceae bacterium]|nr:DivIVA domain-containing protein [Oscillospiraceae bacterium]
MNAKDIITRKFEKATFNGYKTDDVDDFLREVSNEYAQLQKDKSELERKLEVLADKIREYRDDEDALKDALLLAQKQGNAIVSESKAAAEKLRKETTEAVTKQLSEAKEKSEKMVKDADDYAKRMTKDSNERADKLVKDARAKAEEIRTAMNRQQEIQEQILQKTRKEVTEYRSKIMEQLKHHMEFIESLPDKVENDFVRKTAAEVEKREAERAKEERAREAERAKEAERVKAAAAKQAAAQKSAAVKQEPKPENSETTDEPFKAEEKEEAGKTAEMPFFNSENEGKRRRSDLQFGKNKS